MAENSKIEWTHHTFNPWIGCTKVSAACDNCYAEAWDARFKGDRWGPKADRTRTKTWRNPIKWNRKAKAEGTRYRVFCASLADVFDNHKSILPEWRNDLWKLIRETPHLDWLLLTKRPQNIERYLPDDWDMGYHNVWLGTTVENQVEADRRIPHLLSNNARIHFLSCEPLLEQITIEDYLPRLSGFSAASENYIGWVIAGGENDKNFREPPEGAYQNLLSQCSDEPRVPFLFKQWSGDGQKKIKAMGRRLDGVIHDGYPIVGNF